MLVDVTRATVTYFCFISPTARCLLRNHATALAVSVHLLPCISLAESSANTRYIVTRGTSQVIFSWYITLVASTSHNVNDVSNFQQLTILRQNASSLFSHETLVFSQIHKITKTNHIKTTPTTSTT